MLVEQKEKVRHVGARQPHPRRSSIPFCAVVLATEYGHFFVVQKGRPSERSPLCVVHVTADVLR